MGVTPVFYGGASTAAYGLYGAALGALASTGYNAYKRAHKRPKLSDYDRWIPDAMNTSSAASTHYGNTNQERPGDTNLKGHVSLGDRYALTTSRRTVRTGHRGRPKGAAVPSIVWRWQSLKPIPPTAAGAVTGMNRSMDLSYFISYTHERDATGVLGGAWMPMYAFDLGTQPGNGFNVSTKTHHQLESFPMYRLRKNCSLGIGLAPSTTNYEWKPMLGYQNGPSQDYTQAFSPFWSPEIMQCPPQTVDQVKHDWSEIQLMFQCSRVAECKIHVALVKFDNYVGPRRLYSVNAVSPIAYPDLYTAGPVTYTDDVIAPGSGEDEHGVDVFWESFWDKRIAHPLSRYNQANKAQRIRFISHDVIDSHQDLTNYAMGTIDRNYTHVKRLFYSGGKWTNCLCNTNADNVVTIGGAGATNFGQVAPVIDNAAVTAPATTVEYGFNQAHGFNVVQRYQNEHKLYDDFTRKRESDNTWLLIWMDMPLGRTSHPHRGEQIVAPSTNPPVTEIKYNWPPCNAFDTVNEDTCCTFDMCVRSKFRYVPARNLVATAGGTSAYVQNPPVAGL